MATILDVAKVAGVSKSTVSRAFTNPATVHPKTLALINRTAKNLSYTPNALARAMITKKTENIGFIIHEEQFPVITNPFYGQILETIVEQTGQRGYSLFISSARGQGSSPHEMLLQKQVDGVILASTAHPDMLRRFLDRGTPVVLVNYHTGKDDVCGFLSDDAGGVESAVAFLARNYCSGRTGRRDIGVIEGRFSAFIYKRRHEAFLQAMEKQGLQVQSRYMAITKPAIQDAYKTALELLRNRRSLAALLCTNDVIAAGAIKAAHALGLKVPGDIAITGYDNSDLCAACDPAITSVDANTQELGVNAVDCLFRQIGGEIPAEKVHTVKTKLIRRESA
jgi:DNA-binding LacI/PurR family transcriptional regulator